MINSVIIFGGHIQALGLIRQVKAIGLYTILIIPDKYSVARYSKYLDEVLFFSDNQQLLQYLINCNKNNTLLFPTNDEYIEFLNNNRTELEASFHLGLPSNECVNIFANKISTFEFTKKFAICHPVSWCPNNLDDLRIIADHINYPIVVKPAIMYSFHKKFGKKAFLCTNKQALISKCEFISKFYDISNIVLQEYLSGGAQSLFSFGAFSVKGVPKAWIIANRIRQNPMDFGNSTTYAVKCYIPEIEIQAQKSLTEDDIIFINAKESTMNDVMAYSVKAKMPSGWVNYNK
jgi:D-aspartate ligase